MENSHLEWNKAIQISKEQAQADKEIAQEQKEIQEQMQEEFNEMMGQEGVTYGSVEEMVHSYGFDADKIEDLIENFI